jgi:HTH-type transcriptional regulator / antitoxin HigA
MARIQEAEGFTPDWCVHPGDVLDEYIDVRGLSQAELARRADVSPKLISEILSGANRITPSTALALDRVLGLEARAWMNLQSEWDLFEARRKPVRSPDTLDGALERFPVKELMKQGLLPRGLSGMALLDRLLALLGISSLDAYASRLDRMAVKYRHSPSFKSTQDHVYVWLQLGVREAERKELPAYDAKAFALLVQRDYRALTRKSPDVFWPELVKKSEAAGVAVVLTKPFSGTKLSGAAHWTDKGNPVIQLSLRHKSNDQFWWTLFHECGHVIKHPHLTFADDVVKGTSHGQEAEADAFALDALVGSRKIEAFAATMPRSAEQIVKFADDAGIHAGIVVGMLQHRGVVEWGHLNRFKCKIDFAEPDA